MMIFTNFRRLNLRGHLLAKDHRADIDGLRAIAILLVVGNHFFPWRVTGGFIGVDVFL